MNIDLSTPISNQAFFAGYGLRQKEGGPVSTFLKGLGGIGKFIVGPRGQGRSSSGQFEKYDSIPKWIMGSPRVRNYGLPTAVGGGVAGHSYVSDDDPNKTVASHLIRGAGAGAAVSPAFWGKSRSVLGGPKRGVAGGAVVSGSMLAHPWAKRKAGQAFETAKTLSYIVAALAASGMTMYAINRYIKHRRAKAIEDEAREKTELDKELQMRHSV